MEKWYRVLAPRSTVLIGSVNKEGVSNAAPFSFVMPISASPPLIAFASAPSRHTLANIRDIGDFTVNIPGKKILAQVWECGAKFPKGVSEIKETGLTELPIKGIKSPGIKECFAIFSCRFHKEYPAGDHILVIGEIIEIELQQGIIRDGQFDPGTVQPILHVGGEIFSVPGEKIIIK